MLDIEDNILIILVCCLVGLIWAILNAVAIAKVKITGEGSASRVNSYNQFQDVETQPNSRINLVLEIASYIEKGSNAFLFAEYKYIGVFVVLMAFVIFFAVED